MTSTRQERLSIAPRGAVVFAYGSNTDPDQMRTRCPSAVALSTGMLRGHTLVFAGFSEQWNGAVSDLRPARGRTAVGVLYRLSQVDLTALDRHEGVPFVYERRRVTIVDRSGARVPAFVYRQTEPEQPLGMPSHAYLRRLVAGYLHHGLNPRRIARALQETVP